MKLICRDLGFQLVSLSTFFQRGINSSPENLTKVEIERLQKTLDVLNSIF